MQEKNNKTLLKFKNKNFDILTICIYDTSPIVLYQEVQKKIKNNPNFFKNIPIIIDINNINYPKNWSKLYQAILNTKLNIIGICCHKNNILKQIITKNKLSVFNENIINKTFTFNPQPLTKQNYVNQTKIINRPVRSGQQIFVRNSDLIITNNVNAGAEIIADGNIHIYGIMKGRIIAGASGNKKSQIFSTKFYPEIISIGGKYLSQEQIPKQFLNKSVKIYLKDNIFIIQNLNLY